MAQVGEAILNYLNVLQYVVTEKSFNIKLLHASKKQKVLLILVLYLLLE